LAVRFGIIRPARYCSPDAAASTASRPASMTLRNAPLSGRDVMDMHLIWVGGEGKYF